jgi:hypothetical protein
VCITSNAVTEAVTVYGAQCVFICILNGLNWVCRHSHANKQRRKVLAVGVAGTGYSRLRNHKNRQTNLTVIFCRFRNNSSNSQITSKLNTIQFGPRRCKFRNKKEKVKVNNQLDATKYAVLLPQHVSGTNMPIIRNIINK